MIQKKYLFILIGFALELQAAEDGGQRHRFTYDLREYLVKMIDFDQLKTRLESYTQAELSSPDRYNFTPLMDSIEHSEIFKLLLDAGADSSVQVNGKDVLTFLFKKAYTDGGAYSLLLNQLKETANMNEEKVLDHARLQGIEFNKHDRDGFDIQYRSSMLPISAFPLEGRARRDEERAGRDYEMVKLFLYPPDGCLTKGAKKK